MTQIVSSLSSLPIYAPSAAYAPTNGADVSAIASAYSESAASSKLDSTASSQFITSTAGLATTAYVDSSVSSKLDTTAFSTVSSNFLTSETVTATAGDGVYITSINGSGISGAGGGNAFPVTYNSGYVSAELTTGYFAATSRPSLIISSTAASVYPRFIVTNGTDNGSNLRKGSYYLSDAFEFTTGSANNSGAKVLRVDPQQISSKNFLLYGPSGSTTYGTLALRGSDSNAYVLIGSGGVEHTNYVRPSAISSWWNVYDHVNSASASWGGGGIVTATAGDGTSISSINEMPLLDTSVSSVASAIASSYSESAVSSKQDSSAMSAYVEKTSYDNLYSAFTAVSSMLNTYSSYFSSISAKVDSSAIGVEE